MNKLSNSFGKIFNITSFGESHGKVVGAVVDGCPSGLEISEEFVQKELNKRRPGQSEFHSNRREEDKVEILSGILEGKTIGAPISFLVKNKDADSSRYKKSRIRPGHADITYQQKYRHYDYRGGGRASGRETVARVCAGALAKKILSKYKTSVLGHVKRIGEVETEPSFKEIKENTYQNELRCAEPEKLGQMKDQINKVQEENDSIGGLIEIIVKSPFQSLGEPVFDKIEARFAKAILSIGATKGIEFGAGFSSSKKKGSEMNDPIRIKNGEIIFKKNDSGGMLGGITTGQNIIFRVPIKPTPSIGKKQESVNIKEKKETDIQIKGRHDPCICPRVLPVIESMTRVVLVDLGMLANKIPMDTF